MCADVLTVATDRSDAPPAEPLRLRPMDWRRDRDAVMSFQYETYEGNFPGFRITEGFIQDFSEQLRRALRSRWERALVLVDKRGRVYGFIWLALMSTMVEDWMGYIKNIYVSPELRGRGYARMMLDEAERWFATQNVSKVSLDASACNPRAVELYRTAGFHVARYRMEKPL
jgi:ribosomal protein S18 acetylase RimI-like enzyme